jgi:hypothetical protein
MRTILGSLATAPHTVSASVLRAGAVSADETAVPKHAPSPAATRPGCGSSPSRAWAPRHGSSARQHDGPPDASASYLTPTLGSIA